MCVREVSGPSEPRPQDWVSAAGGANHHANRHQWDLEIDFTTLFFNPVRFFPNQSELKALAKVDLAALKT